MSEGQALRAPTRRAVDPIPVDIAFLANHGVAPSLLRAAARRSALLQIPAPDVILAEGIVEPEAFYRALALECGLRFLSRITTADSPRFPESILAGLVALRRQNGGLDFAFAPRGGQIEALLQRSSVDRRLALTTPEALRDGVFRERAGAIAEQAANTLPDATPHLSFRGQASLGQRAFTMAAAGLGAFLGTLAPVAALAAGLSLAGLVFLGMAVVRIAACLERHGITAPERTPRWADADLPIYTLLVPLHREAAVVAQLCTALQALDYPLAKLDIKLIVESHDTQTRAALAGLDLPAAFEIIVAPPGAPTTKPRALNVALPPIRGEYVTIYDAEDEPEPGQLRLAVATFARLESDVGCLQARLAIDNARDNALTRLFAIEYAALFDAVNPGLATLGLPVPLGGTSNHLRVDLLRRIGGWDAWNVTEDADLGIRLALTGHRVADLPSTTYEEAPGRLGNWMRQRSRWMKGYMQVCVTHSRHPVRTMRRLGVVRFLAAVALTLGSVSAALFYPAFLVFSGLAVAGVALPETIALADVPSATIGLVTFATGWVSMLLPAVVGLWRRRWFGLLPWAALLPVYYGLVSMAAWRGLFEFLVDDTHWHKTEHGLTRRRLRGAPPVHGQRHPPAVPYRTDPRTGLAGP